MGFDSEHLVHQNRHNIAPRLGVAYRPWGNNTVLRAGWGMFYNVVPFVYALDFGDVPFVSDRTVVHQPDDEPAGDLPASVSRPPARAARALSVCPWRRTRTTRRPIRCSTTSPSSGSNGTPASASPISAPPCARAWMYNYNSPVPDTRPFIEKPRPFPELPGDLVCHQRSRPPIQRADGGGAAATLRGLYFQSSWTWARDRYDLDYNWDFSTLAVHVGESLRPQARNRSGAGDPDAPLHAATSFTNYLSARAGISRPDVSKWANLLVGGWEITGIYTLQTGQFLTPFWSGADPVGIALYGSAIRPT